MSGVFLLHYTVAFNQNVSSGKKEKPKLLSMHSVDTLFSDKSNLFFLQAKKEITPSLKISVSQGRISEVESQIYEVDSLQNGVVDIILYIVYNGKNVLLEKKKFIVITSLEQQKFDKYKIKPIVSILGYQEGKIPHSVLKEACKIEINKGFEIIEFNACVDSRRGFSEAVVIPIRGEYLDSYIMNLLPRIPTGGIFVIDRLKLKDVNGNIFMYPKTIVYEVVADAK